MNNYCTNCGAKLKSKDLVCSNCNTPIIDIPDKIVDKHDRKGIKIAIIILSSILGILLLGFCIYMLKVNKIKKELIIPYVKENYNLESYSVKYSKKGRCIIDGDTYFNPFMACGGSLKPYQYLPEDVCSAYYFELKFYGASDDDKTIITAVYLNDLKYVVEGKNIYGKKEGSENTILKVDKFPYKGIPAPIYRIITLEFSKYKLDIFHRSNMYSTVDVTDDSILFNGVIRKNPKMIGTLSTKVHYYDDKFNEVASCDTKLYLNNEELQEYECKISNKNNIEYYSYDLDLLN